MAGSKRIGQVCRLKPEHYEMYKEMHANVWPEILDLLTKVNIRNYSIYYCNKTHLLFFTMEYIGNDFDYDMATMSKEPKFKEWWLACGAICLEPLEPTGGPPPWEGGPSWISPMEELFHDGHSATEYL